MISQVRNNVSTSIVHNVQIAIDSKYQLVIAVDATRNTAFCCFYQSGLRPQPNNIKATEI